MSKLYTARRNGHTLKLTQEQYDALPETEKTRIEFLVGGKWVRPERFSSDGADLDFS